MKEKQKKKKKFLWQKYVYMAFCVLLGVACGGLMVTYMNSSGFEKTFREGILSFFVLILTLYAALFVQIIIHEAGHLVFGLLSGYKFSSFRVMSFMWVKEGGRIKFRRLTIAGTGGQCLMSPPELSDGKIPVVLYNFGGSLMNIIA